MLVNFILTILLIASQDTTALTHYRLGLKYYRQGRVEEAIFELKQALKIDPKLADAHNQLAIIYMNQGTVAGRTMAEWELEKALKIDPNNVKYNLNLGLLLVKKNMLYSAEKQFKKVLNLDPQNSTACFHLGLINEKLALRYKEMIDPEAGEGIISLREFGERYEREAIKYFTRAIRLDPHLTSAYHHLGLIYYERGDFENMVRTLQKALQLCPEDKNSHLLLGLAYHKRGLEELGMIEYKKAMSLMSQRERELFESMELVCSPQEEEHYRNCPPSERDKLRKTFWKRRDPIFMTDYNERLLEHYGRVAYATMRFGSPDGKLEGWETDQGRVYIRYGEPLFKTRTRPWIDVKAAGSPIGPASGSPIHPSREVWEYEGFNIVFEDRFLSGHYRFKRGFSPETDYRYRYEEMIKSRPEIYEHDFQGKKFDFPYYIASFRGHEGKTAVEIYYGIPQLPIRVSYSPRTDVATAQIRRGIFFFDEDWEEVFRDVKWRFLSTEVGSVQEGEVAFRGREIIEIEPGSYYFALELKDEKSDNIGVQRKKLTVEPYGFSKLQLSDIVLAQRIRPLSLKAPLSRKNLEILPNLTRTYREGEDIYVYYEIYNLKKDESGRTHFRIRNTISPKQREEKGMLVVISDLKKLLRMSRKEGKVTTSSEFWGSSETERQYRVFWITTSEPGDYELTVEVMDLNSGKEAKKRVEFKIK